MRYYFGAYVNQFSETYPEYFWEILIKIQTMCCWPNRVLKPTVYINVLNLCFDEL